MKWLISLFLVFSLSANALTVDISRKFEAISFINILFLTATFGEYKCLDDLIEKSKFLKFIKVKSIDLNINNIRSSNNLEEYETLIEDKIENGNFDYIIIIDESYLFNTSFYEKLEKDYPNKIITISHNSSSDIRLFIDFNRFFLLLKELNLVDKYDIYYLHNKDNDINELYYNILNMNNGDDFSLRDVQICYTSDLNRLINKIKLKEGVILVSNMDVLYDDVSGKTLNQYQIMNLINDNSIPTLNISHNSCSHKPTNSAFYLLWDNKELIDIIDAIITQRRLDNSSDVYILSSKFNVNLSLNNILKSPDVKKLKSLLEFTDDVIIKE